MPKVEKSSLLTPVLIVGTLGYFVDMYDLVLFVILRIPSFRGLGVPEAQFLEAGMRIQNWQMFGMLLGGLLWGLCADRIGRVRALLFSVATFSLANLCNAFVTGIEGYAAARFFAGVGLAGELGVAVTLATESLAVSQRNYAVMIIAGVGFLGAICAGLLGNLLPWRASYFVGGMLGLLLLFTRAQLRESSLFLKATSETSGSLRALRKPSVLRKLLLFVIVGTPTWFIAGILATFSFELGKAFSLQREVHTGTVILLGYVGVILGDIVASLLSQFLHRRRAVVIGMLGALLILVSLFFFVNEHSMFSFYLFYLLFGIAGGYLVVTMTMLTENFGTDIRGTLSTVVPNLIRASVIPITFLFKAFQDQSNPISAGYTTGLVVILSAFFALLCLPETYGRDLDFVETRK